MHRIEVIDSHTGGEPTRVVIEGGPDLGAGTLAERRARFRAERDEYRTAIVSEPRGSGPLVGALLCEPHAQDCVAGVIFFDNAGYLGMCGHGMMGLVVTLAHLGRIGHGSHRIDTPAGVVTAELSPRGNVTVRNVPSVRHAASVDVDVPGHGRVTGDVAWGGNWFYLVEKHDLSLSIDNVDALMDYSGRVLRALGRSSVTGADGATIDHVELVGPSPTSGVDARSFVLCPSGAYDRSPCGTGTSAKLACLHADGKLAPGQTWRQESLIGSVFEARFTLDPSRAGWVVPSITGSAHVTAETTLLLDERDPFRHGIQRAWT
jgi:4-hydroxyproline epimerase